MTIALIISEDRLREEQAMLHRLVVGLMNENNHVIRCLPKSTEDQFDSANHSAGLSVELFMEMPCSFIERSKRKRDAVNQMLNLQVDAMIAFGSDAEQLAIDVKKHIDVPLFAELTSLSQASRIRSSQPVSAWLAPTHSIERQAEARVGDERVVYTPMGTHTTATEHEDPCETRCVVVLDACGNIQETETLLKQLQHHDNIHIFLELTHKRNKRIQQFVQSMNMQQRVTLLGNVSELRQLIPSADALVMPHAHMQLRSIVLEAMGANVPIVCVPSDAYDMLIDDETAFFVEGNYEAQLERVFHDKHASQLIVNNAHTLIESSYGSSKQIAAYDSLLSLF